jgi:hypothetical protein
MAGQVSNLAQDERSTCLLNPLFIQ